jgi:hypothetical protein
MKVIKLIAILLLVYAGIVIAFESLLGYFQPANESTIVITTVDEDGTSNDRVLALLESDGQLYVSANHWPRAWYNRSLANPQVEVTRDGEQGNYLAVPVTGMEHDRVNSEHSHGPMFRILTGFPPRYFIRLDPR